tara:strand:- start:945 stop:1181 length:237 start_codon:yes stop_codon:yes gene_type:complete
MSISSIIEIFEDILDLEKGIINLQSTPLEIDQWDSVATVNIIVALEEEFRIKFKLEDIQEAISVKDFVELVQANKKNV